MGQQMLNYSKAGFIKRMFARLIDRYLVLIIFLAVSFPIVSLIKSIAFSHTVFSRTTDVSISLLLIFVLILLGFVYDFYLTSKFGGTLGKMLMGLIVVDDNAKLLDIKTAFWRVFAGYSASSVFLGLGFLWIFVGKENLAWHDKLFGTKVIKVGSPFWGILTLLLLPVAIVIELSIIMFG